MCAKKCVILHFPENTKRENLGRLLFGKEGAMGIGAYAITQATFTHATLTIVTMEHEFSIKQVLVENLPKLRRFDAFREYGEEEVGPLFGSTLSVARTLVANDEEDMLVRSTRHALDLGATEIIHVVPPDTLERRRELLVAFMNRANVSARLHIETSPQ